MDLDALVYADEAAEFAGVGDHNIRRWAKRYPQTMPVCDRDDRGRPRYRLRDVLKVELATRTGRRLTA